MLEDEMSKMLSAMTVFSLAIKYMVDDATADITKRHIDVLMSDITWVLTVPAIWTDSAKKFMRLAAEKAGISSDKLLIALEPECASILCRYLPVNKKKDETGTNMSVLPTGSKFMTIDAGGGTIDTTVYEVDKLPYLKEITAASGGDWGGKLIDEAFEQVLIDIFGRECFQHLKENSTEDWLDLWREFEIKKRQYRNKDVIMRVPFALFGYQEDQGNDIIQKSKYSSDIQQHTFKKDKIKIKASLWVKLFETSISKIIDHLTDLLSKPQTKDVKLLVMVGGFSTSMLFQEKMRASFEADKYTIIIPSDASTAVLRGAVIFGHDPTCISQRVLQYTYGIKTNRPFIEGKHPDSKRVVRDSGIKCTDCFSKHVEIGQIVKFGVTQESQYYTPTNRNQTSLAFPLYYSCKRDPVYTDDVGCHRLETFEVPLTDPSGDLDSGVYVTFTFSGTEIHVEGKEKKTGLITKAKFELKE
ncbi:hypothetical protein ACF0H5_003492 [Mactra antiquata]